MPEALASATIAGVPPVVGLSVARDVGQVRDVLHTAGDREHVFPTLAAAVAAARG